MKQKLKTIVASRSFQIAWCSVFLGLSVAIGLLEPQSSATAGCAWGLAGFMLAMLLVTLLRNIMLRQDFAEIAAREQQMQRGIEHMVEHVKEELVRFGVEVEMGMGEPPWDRRGRLQ